MSDTPPRVLVVDDSEVIRNLIAMNLEFEGFEVFTAVDGQDALEKVSQLKPDVVTLDVMMPRLDGFTTASRLKADAATRDVAIVMVTAMAQEADIRRGRDIGVEAYLTKPFDPDELIALVRGLADGSGG